MHHRHVNVNGSRGAPPGRSTPKLLAPVRRSATAVAAGLLVTLALYSSAGTILKRQGSGANAVTAAYATASETVGHLQSDLASQLSGWQLSNDRRSLQERCGGGMAGWGAARAGCGTGGAESKQQQQLHDASQEGEQEDERQQQQQQEDEQAEDDSGQQTVQADTGTLVHAMMHLGQRDEHQIRFDATMKAQLAKLREG